MLNTNRKLTGPLFVGLLLCVTACSSQQNIHFSVIKESNQCRTTTAQITQLASEEEQKNIINQLNRFSDTQSLEKLTLLFEQHAANEHLFLVAQGQKPSAGYGFKIVAESGSLIEQTLTLPIYLTKPEPDSMQAQVMTSPCMILGIDSKADYQKLVIDDLVFNLNK